jgi:hypothetical protein
MLPPFFFGPIGYRLPERRWRLWFLIPSGILGVICLLPLVVFGMFIGSRLFMVVAGPVNIWNMT